MPRARPARPRSRSSVDEVRTDRVGRRKQCGDEDVPVRLGCSDKRVQQFPVSLLLLARQRREIGVGHALGVALDEREERRPRVDLALPVCQFEYWSCRRESTRARG